jgi:phosphoglycolate phosphatase-like HAD superfamily hydrolase
MIMHNPATLFIALLAPLAPDTGQKLPSWTEGVAKKSIVEFVGRVTTEGSPDFVPRVDRVAVFDNDGTLWSEQPMYVQVAFVLDRIKELARKHPEWKRKEPFKSVLDGNVKGALASGGKALMELLSAGSAGITTEEYDGIVKAWFATARHPRFKRPYTDLVYQPMLELLSYLRSAGFKTCIVSGGGVEFMRPWAERIYGIPPEQVIGSSVKVKYEVRGGRPALLRPPEIDFIDDNAGKPVGIHRFTGRRPIFAAGNSDGDRAMIEWTTAGSGARFGLIVNHTDAEREWAYDRQSAVGRLDKVLDQATELKCLIVDMKHDWKVVYQFQK